MSEQMRADFEAVARRENYSTARNACGKYIDRDTDAIWFFWQAAYQAGRKAERQAMFPLSDEARFILGRPNFWCASIACALRQAGHEIKTSSEDEQAYVIHWMLGLYFEHGDTWRDVAHKFLLESGGKDGGE